MTVNSDLDPGSSYSVDRVIGDVAASDFDGLVVPGGCVGADKLRADAKVIAFVRDFLPSRNRLASFAMARGF